MIHLNISRALEPFGASTHNLWGCGNKETAGTGVAGRQNDRRLAKNAGADGRSRPRVSLARNEGPVYTAVSSIAVAVRHPHGMMEPMHHAHTNHRRDVAQEKSAVRCG